MKIAWQQKNLFDEIALTGGVKTTYGCGMKKKK